MTTPSYRIEPLFLPASLDAPDATDFLEFSDLSDAVVLETLGQPGPGSAAEGQAGIVA